MEVTLLGTAAADGWPNPWCGCTSCTDARARGDLRRQTAALVDGALLLDLPPALPGGVPLAGVHTVLITHAHPDHCSPFALLWRHWVQPDQPLTVAGPVPVLEACRPWLAPDGPVELVEAGAGASLLCGGYRIRALAADHEVPTVVYDVTGPDGDRLLYATDTGPLPSRTIDALRGAELDLLLLEETFGDMPDHATRHLDLRTFPAELSRLRTAGAVTEGTDVVAVHLGHHNPPAPELAARLASWGARLVPDGARLRTGGERAAGRREA